MRRSPPSKALRARRPTPSRDRICCRDAGRPRTTPGGRSAGRWRRSGEARTSLARNSCCSASAGRVDPDVAPHRYCTTPRALAPSEPARQTRRPIGCYHSGSPAVRLRHHGEVLRAHSFVITPVRFPIGPRRRIPACRPRGNRIDSRSLECPVPTATETIPNKWDAATASGLSEPNLLLYRSNLLGSDLRITNYGGGNTSAKVGRPIRSRRSRSTCCGSRDRAATSAA